jgi:hypothetical protein
MYSIQGFLTWQSKLLMKYKHLSQAERYQIYALMKAGHDQNQIVVPEKFNFRLEPSGLHWI